MIFWNLRFHSNPLDPVEIPLNFRQNFVEIQLKFRQNSVEFLLKFNENSIEIPSQLRMSKAMKTGEKPMTTE